MICIIPARGGSKRIPGKNVKDFCGKPIIDHAVKLGKETCSPVIVSTDSAGIATPLIDRGIIVTARSEQTASDTAELEDVVIEVLNKFQIDDGICCLLLPTGVFATKRMILEAFNKVHSCQTDISYIITEYEHPPQRAMRLTNGTVTALFPMENTQYFDKRYHDAGQFYVFDIAAFRKAWSGGIRLLQMEALPIIIPPHQVHDIDTPEDWAIAEMKWKLLHS